MSKTIRVRIAVATSNNGRAIACGMASENMQRHPDPEKMLGEWGMLEDFEPEMMLRFSWVEATVALPEDPGIDTIEGTVTP